MKRILKKPYYKIIGFINFYRKKRTYHRNDLYFSFSYKHLSWNLKGGRTFEERAEKTAQLFFSAMEAGKNDIHGNINIGICCQDYIDKDKKILAYSKSREQKKVIAIPDFSFINWKQCGIEDYDSVCQEIVKASKVSPKYSTLFWIGNIKTHPSRKYLCEIARTDKRIEAYGMNWIKNENGQTASKYVSLVDHTKYRYLIDIQGVGWSARTKLLFFTGRPLFLVDRKWREYWYDDIEAYVHYIPVKEDLSDLIQQLNWAEDHPEEVKIIAQNAQKFAMENLTKECAVQYLIKVLQELGDTKQGKEL